MAWRESFRGSVPDALLARLEPLARQLTLRAGQIVIGLQDQSKDVYLIVEGSLRVEIHSLGGREVVLADLGAGELFGEYAALDTLPRTASVSATSACRLACVPGDAFREAVLASPDTAEWLARRLVGRIRLLTERNFELNALAVRNRLHCELLRLSLDAGIADNAAAIAPAPTHAQFAARIGTHREAVTRELQYLQKRGIVRSQGKTLQVCDVSQLIGIVRAASGDVGVAQRASEGIGE